MGGAVQAVFGGGNKKSAPAPTPEPVKATRVQTDAAMQRQAQIRARRGSGSSLLAYDRTLGGQSPLEGEDMK